MPEAKTVLDPAHRAELAARIRSVSEDAQGLWGKMTPAQMFEHCQQLDLWVQRGGSEKQTLIGRLVGWYVLRSIMKPGASLPKNVPTLPTLVAKGGEGFEVVRQAWLDSLEGYADFSAPSLMHDFFGRMSRDKAGEFVWKHADHHLTQFGV